MKRNNLLHLAVAMIINCTLTAQVAINNDGSNPDNSAMLDVKSTAKGLLIPRLTNAQMLAIENPADGLLVYSTDEHKFYAFNEGNNAFREIEFGSGTIAFPASYTIGSGGSCSNTTVNGLYYKNTALNTSNNVNIDATVTTVGSYMITTDTVNGYSFSGNGDFVSTGVVQLTLFGRGTPLLSQTDNFVATASDTMGTCTFSLTVTDIPEVYNPATGKTWMDRNLGASQVATAINDANAYGYLYQWGRFTEGHESRTSTPTTTKATTPVPNLGNSWDGMFITELYSPWNWLTTVTDTLWQGLNGANNPCPYGFRIPTEAEWEEERLSWSSNDATGAYNSPLKLTCGGYHNGHDGSLSSTGGYGHYWSSTVDGLFARRLYFHSTDAYMNSPHRVYGFSVRCIKDY